MSVLPALRTVNIDGAFTSYHSFLRKGSTLVWEKRVRRVRMNRGQRIAYDQCACVRAMSRRAARVRGIPNATARARPCVSHTRRGGGKALTEGAWRLLCHSHLLLAALLRLGQALVLACARSTRYRNCSGQHTASRGTQAFTATAHRLRIAQVPTAVAASSSFAPARSTKPAPRRTAASSSLSPPAPHTRHTKHPPMAILLDERSTTMRAGWRSVSASDSQKPVTSAETRGPISSSQLVIMFIFYNHHQGGTTAGEKTIFGGENYLCVQKRSERARFLVWPARTNLERAGSGRGANIYLHWRLRVRTPPCASVSFC